MPKPCKTGKVARGEVLSGAIAALMLLAGCLAGTDPATRSSQTAGELAAPGGSLAAQKEVRSQLIADLQARQSVLPPAGPFAQIGRSVVQANSGAAAAELRIARLRAEAKSHNWLPQIGPQVSLTSLGALAGSLLVQQTLLDNGRRKAERAYAAADVEVAAVGLSTEMNQKIYTGLSYYIEAERARAQAAVSMRAAAKLGEFTSIMQTRVEGGISDRSEQRVIAQTQAEMQATLAGDQSAESSAMAQLAALTSQPLNGLRGLDTLLPAAGNPEPLSVMQARGEGARSIAEARIARSGLLPGLGAVATVGGGGLSGELQLESAGLGVGTGASIKALDATADVVDRRIADASQLANRNQVALEQQIATLQSRQAQASVVLAQTEANLQLFTEQYKVGRRSLLELVGQYDSYARLQRDQVSLTYDIALLQLQIGRDRGVLIDGANL